MPMPAAPMAPLPALEEIAAHRVLVVGDVMLDRYWFGSVDRISPEAPVPVVRVSDMQDRLGGAANVALNVKMLGSSVTLMSMVGQDDAARALRGLLTAQGIDAVLGEDPQLQTITKLRVIGRSQQLIRLDFETEPDHEALAPMRKEFDQQVRQHDVVLFSDYGKGGLGHISDMLASARAAGVPVLVDPKGRDYERYRGATLITPNRSELMQVVGNWRTEAELHAKVEALRGSLDLSAVLLTRSEEGMTLFSSEGVVHVPALAREVYDVTGAGDTVIAVVAGLMAAGMPMADAVRWANKAAGIVVGKFGTAHVSHAELAA